MKIADSENNSELEKIHETFSTLLDSPYNSLIVSTVDGTRKSNSRYKCAIYQPDKVSLVEKSARSIVRAEFNFTTREFSSTLPDIQPLATFTQTLSDLIQKVQKGKATLLKKM